MATNPTVLEFPKKEKKSKRGKRNPRGNVFLPTYTVKLADGSKETRVSRFYHLRYTVDGERKSEATNCTSKTAAHQLLTDRLGKADRGELADFMEYKNVTFASVAARLRTFYKEELRRSLDKLEISLKRLEDIFGIDCRVVSITPERISEYRAFRLAQPGTQFPTVNRELAALKTAFRLAVAEGKMRKMPQFKISSEKDRKDEGEFSKDQLAALQVHAPAYLKPLLRWLSLTGMRIMEPLGLTWGEVNLEHGELRLAGRRTKNGEQKVLHISGDLLELLKERRNAPTACDRVFTDPEGQPLRYDAVLDHFQQSCKRAEIKEGFTDANGTARVPGFHDFRRTFARMADRAGVPHRTIMEIAGWKSVAMLLRYLGTSKASEQRAAFNLLADSIR